MTRACQSVLLLFAFVLLSLTGSAASAAPDSTSDRKFILLAAFDSARSTNAKLVPGRVEKFVGNPLLRQEHAWEPSFDNLCPSVLWDEEEQIYKLWYSIFVVNVPDVERTTPERRRWLYRESGVCYATSGDGIHWQKPLRADLPFRNQPSNVVMRNAHGAGVFKDLHEENPARRYKMFFQRERNGRRQTVAVAFSRDGIHWEETVDLPNVKARADTHNNALWAPALGKYVAITRDWDFVGRSARLVARTESSDFMHWSESRVVLSGLENQLQIYGMPVFAYEGIYLGLPAIFRTREDRLHVELAWSSDTIEWQRIAPGTAFIANAENKGDYDWGCIFAAASPIIRADGIKVYYSASDNTHFGHRKAYLALATLRPDGFVGVTGVDPQRPAEIVTHGFDFSGERLHLSADIDAGGSIQVILEEPDSGREITRSALLEGNQQLTNRRVDFILPAGTGGTRVKARFVATRATLYSFSISPK